MFQAWTRMRKLEEATNSNDEPAPLYLLDEIYREAQQGMQEVGPIVEFCVKRLTAKPAVVKQKTLRLIRHLCIKGANEFRRAMARQSASVKNMLHYKGEPDPLKGDVPNQKVRDSAREALDALYGAETGYAPSATAAPQLTNRIQGFGSTNYSSGGSSSGFSGSKAPQTGGMAEGILSGGLAVGQAALNLAAGAAAGATGSGRQGNKALPGMQGFGNPRFEPVGGRASNYSPPPTGSRSNGGNLSSFGARSSPSRWGSSVAGAAGSAISGAGTAISGALSPTHCGRGSEHMLGYQAAEKMDTEDAAVPSWRSQSPTQQRPPRSNAPGFSAAGSAIDIVDRVCSAGGIRAQPTAEELRTFVEAIGELDGLQVGSLLAVKMKNISWQAQLRALCATEAVIQQGSTASCGEIAVFFQAPPIVVKSDPDALRTAAGAQQATVRACARRVLSAIGADTLPQDQNAAPSSPPTAAAASEPQPDLLGGLVDEAAPSPPQAAPDTLLADAAAADVMYQQPEQQVVHAASEQHLDFLDSGGGYGLQPNLQPSAMKPHMANANSDMFAGIELAAGEGKGSLPMPPHQAPPSDRLLEGLSLAEDELSSTGGAPELHSRQTASQSEDVLDMLSDYGASAVPSMQPPQQQQQQQQQQQMHSFSNGTGRSHTLQARHTRPSLRSTSGSGSNQSGAFDDLDAEVRPLRPSMGTSALSRGPGLLSAGQGGLPGMSQLQQPQQLQFINNIQTADHSQHTGMGIQSLHGQPGHRSVAAPPTVQPQQLARFMAKSHSGTLTDHSPTASRARETLQQMGVPDDFAPVRQERQEAAFDFVGLHINQLKK